jgi:hypothetical protein
MGLHFISRIQEPQNCVITVWTGNVLKSKRSSSFPISMEVFPSLSVTSCLESLNFAKSYVHAIALIKEKDTQ